MIYAENVLICIAAPLVIMMIFTRGNARRFVLAFVIGMVCCLIAAYISGYINEAADQKIEITSIFTSPVIEETMKFIPIMIYALLLEPEDMRIRNFSLSIGAGFATYENCCYLLDVGAGSLGFIMIRGFAVGIMHIVSAAALSYGLILSRRFKLMSVGSVLGTAALAMTFHGLYNLLVSAPAIYQAIGYILPLATVAIMYYPYKRFYKDLSEQNEQLADPAGQN